MFGIANANSPLRFDERMIGSLMLLAAANQIVVVTPFILMGAMGPVSIPAALSQQIAEQLAGICLAQLVRPGAPVVMGSFISHTDMQSGSPGFGGPEAAIGLLASGQIARRFGLPWRAGGGALTSSQSVDAQAAFEGLNTMLPAFLAGANLVLHTCGWLESGLVASYEKFVLDIEIVRILQHQFSPLEFTREQLVPERSPRPGTAGTSSARPTRSRTSATASTARCCSRPRTTSAGPRAAARTRPSARATAWPTLEASYEPPAPLADDVHGRLEEYVARRQKELGD